MNRATRTQIRAQRAFEAVRRRTPNSTYVSFAKSLPALIHTSGLAQSVAFAKAKGKEYEDVIKDLGNVLEKENLEPRCREAPVLEYLHLTRDALDAATWIKRYVEALREE